jgi:hypothetical protein
MNPVSTPPPTSKSLTLTSLASKARLRLDDVALTLQEAGLLKYRQGVDAANGIGEGESVVVTREMVEQVAKERRVRDGGGLLSLQCVRGGV